jgi:hypothetical protein
MGRRAGAKSGEYSLTRVGNRLSGQLALVAPGVS